MRLSEICRVWDVPKAPAAQRAIARGSIPTLVIAGSYDAITSPRAAQASAQPLARATLVTNSRRGALRGAEIRMRAARDGVVPRQPDGAGHRLRRRAQASAVHHRAALMRGEQGLHRLASINNRRLRR